MQLRVLALLVVLVALSACGARPADLREHAQHLAQSAGMRPLVLRAGAFSLLGFLRAPAASSMLRVYIEGDGHAWRTPDSPSDDPTPWSPVSLEMAAGDSSPAVAYLARPCQYVGAQDNPSCTTAIWTNRRYGPEIVASIDAAIGELRQRAGARVVELVGFSGGGAIAALVAARRHDVASLRTVAANLDTALWTARHHVSPLRGSLNPADVAAQLGALPQVHFVGLADDVVEPAVVLAYVRRAGESGCVQVVTEPGMHHGADWAVRWPALLRQYSPHCSGSLRPA
jgi:pimeloyl-ACP methyl ester carboxylesterase